MSADDLGAESVARLFHETYERLAPEYGYRTREASAKPWADVPAQNKMLMVATVGYVLAELDAARAERTEPATGEDDEETVISFLIDWIDNGDDAVTGATKLLAALDLPGRERALREEIEDLQGKLDELWTIADRQSEGIASLIAERDAANAALADVARLLDEARERLVEIKGLHHADGPYCAECSAAGEAYGMLHPCQTYQLTLPDARQHAGGEGGAS